MKHGRWEICWHPDSPGVRVEVWVPWWRSKKPLFATSGQMTSRRHPVRYSSGLPWMPHHRS